MFMILFFQFFVMFQRTSKYDLNVVAVALSYISVQLIGSVFLYASFLLLYFVSVIHSNCFIFSESVFFSFVFFTTCLLCFFT